jgi:3D (Asp-Asp-Asp) domain-containing protein
MPLIAVAFAVSTLLHAGFAMLTPSLSTPPEPTATVVFEPDALQGPSTAQTTRWVAPHSETAFWSGSGGSAEDLGPAHLWSPLQVVGKPKSSRLPIWDPSTRRRAWVDASAVGPVDPALMGSAYLPPIGRPVAWSGSARITMYTCVELGGCAATASGVWPEPGQVAVDPRVIPLGSTVWVQGLGTFVATDTGSLVRGAHLDVFTLSYQDALAWGVQERAVQVFAPRQ